MSSTMRAVSQMRSQSVTQKDIKATFKLRMTKRSSSKTKGLSNEKHVMQPALSNIGKVIKAEIEQ